MGPSVGALQFGKRNGMNFAWLGNHMFPTKSQQTKDWRLPNELQQFKESETFRRSTNQHKQKNIQHIEDIQPQRDRTNDRREAMSNPKTSTIYIKEANPETTKITLQSTIQWRRLAVTPRAR